MGLFSSGKDSKPATNTGIRSLPQATQPIVITQSEQSHTASKPPTSNVQPLPQSHAGGNHVPFKSAHEPGVKASTDSPGIPTQKQGPINYGGILCSREVIANQEALSGIPFTRVINSEVKLASYLYSKVAVVRLSEAKEVAIFLDRDATSPDVIIDVVRMLENSGYKVLRGYFAESKLIMSMSQGHISGELLSAQREIARDPTKTALFQEFAKVVAWGYDNQADDIDWALDHQSSKSQVCFFIGGRYIKPPQHVILSQTMHHMLGIAWQLSDGGSSAQFDDKIEQQAQITMELPPTQQRPSGARIRLRWSGMANDRGTTVTMRIQRLGGSALVKSLEDAGYLKTHMDIFRRVIRSEGGLVCFAGVVGSGKSTSLARLLMMLPPYLKIQSIEDPVELEIPNAYQKTVARDLVSDGPDKAFLSAARAIYRSALNVLYLGEVRDTETGGIARQVVESGHTVYTTTHARSGLGVIDRFVSPQIGFPREVLGAPGILKLLVYQALLPVNCEHCCVSPTKAIERFQIKGDALVEHEEYWARIERIYRIHRDKFRMHDPNGCPVCRRDGLNELNGLNGRTVVCEMVEPDEHMEELILEGKTNKLHRYWRSKSDGRYDSPNLTGKTAQECAMYKASLGQIDPREIEERFGAFETIENRILDALALERSHLHPVSSTLFELEEGELQRA